jgi:hypothetical protein
MRDPEAVVHFAATSRIPLRRDVHRLGNDMVDVRAVSAAIV